MPIYLNLIMLTPILVLVGVMLVAVIPRRMRMARRAQALLAQMPQHELKTVYLAFASGWYRGKGKEMDAKITEEEKSGWTFLKAREANPLKTIRTWGGGVNLDFIRKS
jgi:hypothetical protein